MTTMKISKHEMLKAQWKKMLKNQSESGLSIREWCRINSISHGKFYYWQRIIREESLIQAGTLAVTGQTQFAEIKPSEIKAIKPSTDLAQNNHQDICAVLRSNGNEIEILNGADSNTLEVILRIIGRL